MIPDIVTGLRALLEKEYVSFAASSGTEPMSVASVYGALSVASVYVGQPFGVRYATIAALGLISMTENDRRAVLENLEVGSLVTRLLSEPESIVWPEICVVLPSYAASAITLAEHKRSIKAGIDRYAELLRNKALTPGSGQSLVYMRKLSEAEAFISDPAPSELNYPLLAAEVGVTGATLPDVVASVLTTTRVWAGIAASIESIRLNGKKAIDEASDMNAASSAAAAIDWSPVWEALQAADLA